MELSQAVFTVAIMVYFIGWLGFSCGIATVDRHRDRPLLVILFLGFIWPILVAFLAGATWHRFMEKHDAQQRD